MSLYLNEYVVNRRFGGFEEGGWWYDVGKFQICHGIFETQESAEYARKQMDTMLKEKREGCYSPDSVLCRGWPTIYIEDDPGQDFPTDSVIYE